MAEVLTLGYLKEALLKEISNVTSELKYIKQDFRKFDSQLVQIQNKLTGYEKIIGQTKEIEGLEEEVWLLKKK